ncbi:PIN domain-containing protein [Candidatus Gottesmanbacteria bacterium]|nr:PIN domain-containing protein [Candidatus Gottesmanbacteria bacterium]
MEQVVVDSDLIIDFLRTRKGFFVDLLKLQTEGKIEFFIASVTVFELFSGQSTVGEENELLDLISKLKVISFDADIARLAGEINRNSQYILKLADLAIGATTLFLNAELATKNQKHFSQIPKLKFFKF